VQHLLARKGAARIALIPPEVLEALNAGRLATVNLNEFLATSCGGGSAVSWTECRGSPSGSPPTYDRFRPASVGRGERAA
jgi:hypothetical protein